MRIGVLVACLDALTRLGLRTLLSGDNALELVCAEDADIVVEWAAARAAPRLVIFDDGVEPMVLDRLRSIRPAVGALVLANDPSPDYGMRVVAAGATCLARNADLLVAVHRVARGEPIFAGTNAREIARRYPGDAPPLTPRETEVLRRLSIGWTHAAIAHELGIGVRTVHTHAASIYRKFGVRSKRALIGRPIPADLNTWGGNTRPL
jgi:DNA-binding NarL/FixJ family response regulator